MIKIHKACAFSILSPLIFSLFLWSHTYAQSPGFGATEGYMSFGVQFNAMNFRGDVYSDFSMTRPGIQVHAMRKLGSRVHARLSLGFGQIFGDDIKASPTSTKYARNLHFRNNLKELTLVGTYDLVNSPSRYYQRAGFTPYILAGLGVVHQNPQAKTQSITGEAGWIDLQAIGTEGQGRPGYDTPYNKMQIVIPLGIGLRWKLSRRWDFAIETSVRLTFTDYLDDVGGNVPDPGDLTSDLAKSLSNRSLEATGAVNGTARNLGALREQYGTTNFQAFDGNTYENLNGLGVGSTRGSRGRDIYFVTGFHFTYILDTGLQCPQIRW